MSVDFNMVALWGYKLPTHLYEELEAEHDDFLLYDGMCGKYLFFGKILQYSDPFREDVEVVELSKPKKKERIAMDTILLDFLDPLEIPKPKFYSLAHFT